MPVTVPTMDDYNIAMARIAALEALNPISMEAIDAAINAIDARVAALEQAPGGGPAPTGKTRIKTWDAGDTNVERFDRLYLTTGVPYTFYSLISVRVTDIRVGDEFDVEARFQCSSGSTYWRMLGSYLVAAGTVDGTTGIEIAEAQAENFNNEVHHKPVHQNGYWKAAQDYAELYFNLVAYSAHTQATSGSYVQVDKDYGRMWIAQYR